MLAIIPARGGSKGLPGKNIKPLLGKPLIAYTIEAALNAKSITEVMVSTDDKEIARISEKHGAVVPFLRPDFLASDDSPAIDTYLYVLEKLKEQNKIFTDVVVLLPTCPLRTASDIDNAMSIYLDKKADSVVSYTEEHHPVSWHKKIDEQGRLVPIWSEEQLGNRQTFTKTYYPNGAIYIFKKKLLEKFLYYTDHSFAYQMPRNRSVDIDTMDDFLLAEFYLKQRGT